MSAAVLREAARLLRERAQAVTSWDSIPARVDIDIESSTCDACAESKHLVASYPEPDNEPWLCAECAAIADFEAAFARPTVALAVADFLDHDAELIEQTDKARANDPGIRPVASMRVDRALAVARAYLGDPS